MNKSHKEIIMRLKRVNGHFLKVMAMIDNEEECINVAQQLHAVEMALKGAKKALIYDHINECLEGGVEDKTISSESLLKEFKQITKYL